MHQATPARTIEQLAVLSIDICHNPRLPCRNISARPAVPKNIVDSACVQCQGAFYGCHQWPNQTHTWAWQQAQRQAKTCSTLLVHRPKRLKCIPNYWYILRKRQKYVPHYWYVVQRSPKETQPVPLTWNGNSTGGPEYCLWQIWSGPWLRQLVVGWACSNGSHISRALWSWVSLGTPPRQLRPDWSDTSNHTCRKKGADQCPPLEFLNPSVTWVLGVNCESIAIPAKDWRNISIVACLQLLKQYFIFWWPVG